MLNGQGTPQSTPQGGQALGGSDDTGTDQTELGELDGLLSADDDTDGAGLGDEPGSGDGDTGGDNDNPDGDNDEGQPADDEVDPDGEQEPAAQFTDDTEVELDDGGRKVSVRELKESFSTFTRKTQELAESQRTIEAQAADVVARHSDHLAQRFRALHAELEGIIAPGADPQTLNALAQTDPQQYFAVKARLDMARELQRKVAAQVNELEGHAQRTRQQQEAQADAAKQELLQTEGAKLTGKKWFNADFQTKAVAYARKAGIPEQVARGVVYAGFIEITRKAMLYDEALAKTKNGKQPPKPAPTRPASTPGKGKVMQARQSKGLYEKARLTGDRTDIGKYVLENL
jgi:hypothetical protein